MEKQTEKEFVPISARELAAKQAEWQEYLRTYPMTKDNTCRSMTDAQFPKDAPNWTHASQ